MKNIVRAVLLIFSVSSIQFIVHAQKNEASEASASKSEKSIISEKDLNEFCENIQDLTDHGKFMKAIRLARKISQAKVESSSLDEKLAGCFLSDQLQSAFKNFAGVVCKSGKTSEVNKALNVFRTVQSKALKSQSEEAQETCAMCKDPLSSDVKKLSCGHTFDKKCLEPWLVQSQTCPYCRASTLNFFQKIGSPVADFDAFIRSVPLCVKVFFYLVFIGIIVETIALAKRGEVVFRMDDFIPIGFCCMVSCMYGFIFDRLIRLNR